MKLSQCNIPDHPMIFLMVVIGIACLFIGWFARKKFGRISIFEKAMLDQGKRFDKFITKYDDNMKTITLDTKKGSFKISHDFFIHKIMRYGDFYMELSETKFDVNDPYYKTIDVGTITQFLRYMDNKVKLKTMVIHDYTYKGEKRSECIFLDKKSYKLLAEYAS